jgi:hypothetical protein
VRFTTAALAVAVFLAPVTAARADFPRLGIFRKKQKDEQPQQKAKQLVETLKSDPDEKKRKSAAEDLREQDPRNNSDIMPTLISALQKDPSPEVRAEAAETIGKLKPVAQTAGVALEQTLITDPSEAVRKSAQKALWDYHLNGYRSAGANPAYPQTAEPPLAKPRTAVAPPPVVLPAKPAVASGPVPITTGIGKGAIYPQTAEPPLARPKSRPVETLTPPTPTLTVPPIPQPDAKPVVPSIPPPPATTGSGSPAIPLPPIPMPEEKKAESPVLPLPPILATPAAPTVPPGPIVPSIPPPGK